MKTVILIGTSHTYQRPGNPAESEFRKLITQACASLKIHAIAEEMSLEALAQKNSSKSIGAEIAEILVLDHRYCDPDNEQRRVLNIRDEQNIRYEGFFCNWDAKRIEQEVAASRSEREQYWLAQLVSLDRWPVLFVCGANHIDNFNLILNKKGFRVVILARDWPNVI